MKRQRKKCGLSSKIDSHPSESLPTTVVKSSSFLSNLDFFTSKANNALNDSSSTSSSSPRRSICSTQNLIYDSQGSIDEVKPTSSIVSQELHRFNENGIPILRSTSSHLNIQRSTSNQNIVQREIEVIRAKETELRELGRIQHTSDEHSDPRKYRECLTHLPKSQSSHTVTNGKYRRDSDNHQGLIKGKTHQSNSICSSAGTRVKPSTSNGSKLALVNRMALEKRQCQEREHELK